MQKLIHYPIPAHLSDAYKSCGWRKGHFPIAEKMAEEVLSLPIGPQLSRADIKAVTEMIRELPRR